MRPFPVAPTSPNGEEKPTEPAGAAAGEPVPTSGARLSPQLSLLYLRFSFEKERSDERFMLCYHVKTPYLARLLAQSFGWVQARFAGAQKAHTEIDMRTTKSRVR